MKKKEPSPDSMMTIRVISRERELWRRRADATGRTLTAHIRSTLNAEARTARPKK
jgi:hypothetical protein